tara:strand:- start:10216 stop:15909 length:5694 start_codon:yes stop_codon:yes gene_type:complete
MAKDSKIIRDWVGGINTLAASSDIDDTESKVFKGITNVSPGVIKSSGGLLKGVSMPSLPINQDQYTTGNGFISYSTDYGYCASMYVRPGDDFTFDYQDDTFSVINFNNGINPEERGFRAAEAYIAEGNLFFIYGHPLNPSLRFHIIGTTSNSITIAGTNDDSPSFLLNKLDYTASGTDWKRGIWFVRPGITGYGSDTNAVGHFSRKAINLLDGFHNDWIPVSFESITGTIGTELIMPGTVASPAHCTHVGQSGGTYQVFTFRDQDPDVIESMASYFKSYWIFELVNNPSWMAQLDVKYEMTSYTKSLYAGSPNSPYTDSMLIVHCHTVGMQQINYTLPTFDCGSGTGQLFVDESWVGDGQVRCYVNTAVLYETKLSDYLGHGDTVILTSFPNSFYNGEHTVIDVHDNDDDGGLYAYFDFLSDNFSGDETSAVFQPTQLHIDGVEFKYLEKSSLMGDYSFNGSYSQSVNLIGHGPEVLSVNTFYNMPFSQKIKTLTKNLPTSGMHLSSLQENGSAAPPVPFSSISTLSNQVSPGNYLLAGPALSFDLRLHNNYKIIDSGIEDYFASDNRTYQNCMHATDKYIGLPGWRFGGYGAGYGQVNPGIQMNPDPDDYLGYTFGMTSPQQDSAINMWEYFNDYQNASGMDYQRAPHIFTTLINNSPKGTLVNNSDGYTDNGNLFFKQYSALGIPIKSMFGHADSGGGLLYLKDSIYQNYGAIVNRNDGGTRVQYPYPGHDGSYQTGDFYNQFLAEDCTLESKGVASDGFAIFPPSGHGANVHFYMNSSVGTEYIPLEMGNYLFYINFEHHNGTLSTMKRMGTAYSPEFNPLSRGQVAEMYPSLEFPDTHTTVKLYQTKFCITENTPIVLSKSGDPTSPALEGPVDKIYCEATSVGHSFENKTQIKHGQATNSYNTEDTTESYTIFDVPFAFPSLGDNILGTGVDFNDWTEINSTAYADGTYFTIDGSSIGGVSLGFGTEGTRYQMQIRGLLTATDGQSLQVVSLYDNDVIYKDLGGLAEHPSGFDETFDFVMDEFLGTTNAEGGVKIISNNTSSNVLIVTADIVTVKPLIGEDNPLDMEAATDYFAYPERGQTISGPDQYIEANLLMNGPYSPFIKSMHIWIQKDGQDDMHRVAEVFMNGGYKRAGETQSRNLFYPNIRMAPDSTDYTSLGGGAAPKKSEIHYNNTFLSTAKFEMFSIHTGDDEYVDRSGCYTILYNKLNGIIDNESDFQVIEEVEENDEGLPLGETTIAWSTSRTVNHPGWDYSIPIHAGSLVESFYEEYQHYPFDKLNIKGFRCAAVVGNTSYIGAPTYDINGSFNSGEVGIDGLLIAKEDVIIKSVYGRLSSFSKWGIMAGASNDGDSIIALRGHESRLFEFRKSSIYIRNVEDGLEPVIESVLKGQGVEHQNLTTETVHGVCWINIKGVWLHDGVELKNIGAKLGGDEISVSETRFSFSDIVDMTKNPYVAYDEIAHQLLWYESLGDSLKTRIWVYSFSNESWHEIERKIPTIADSYVQIALTNPIHGVNGNLVQSAISSDYLSCDLVSYQSSNVPSPILYESKEFDFEEPATRKNIKGIYITYRLNNAFTTGNPVSYTVDEDNLTLIEFYDISHGLNVGASITFSGITDTALNQTMRVIEADRPHYFKCIMSAYASMWDADASTNGNDTHWVAQGSCTTETSDGAVLITAGDDTDGAHFTLKDATDLSANLIVDQEYVFSFDAKVTQPGPIAVSVRGGDDTFSGSVSVNQNGEAQGTWVRYSVKFVAESTNEDYIYLSGFSGNETILLDNFVLRPGIVTQGGMSWNLETAALSHTSTTEIKTNVTVKGIADDSTSHYFADTTNFDDNKLFVGPVLGNDVTKWRTIRLKPISAISNVNKFSVSVGDDNTIIPKGFEINDITIVYRKKKIK